MRGMAGKQRLFQETVEYSSQPDSHSPTVITILYGLFIFKDILITFLRIFCAL